MPKNPNSKPKKTVKRDEPMNAAMKFFLAGCIAELYLMIVSRFYIKGNAVQQIAWHDHYLGYLTIVGAAILILGLFVSYLWRGNKKKTIGWFVAGEGAFLAISSVLVLWNMSTMTLLTVLVPVFMLLGILWSLYERECALALTVLGISLILLWIFRRVGASVYLGVYVKIAAVAYIVILVVIALMMKQRKLPFPAKTDPVPVYMACGLSVIAVAVALLNAVAAYYAMWVLAIVVFGLAVYYTVKQL